MKKIIRDFTVVENHHPAKGFSLLTLTPGDATPLPFVAPGQFVQVKVDGSPDTFLRRPISICDVDNSQNRLKLLVRDAGAGTKRLTELCKGESVNIMLPLGHGFTLPDAEHAGMFRPLLVGGGVGTAPLLLLAKRLQKLGVEVTTLIGARSAEMVLLADEFKALGRFLTTTDDGSLGFKGVATAHPVFSDASSFNFIYCCGPAPMMKSVAAKAKEFGVECEVSLENMMACGMGACLCCVENTVKGNVCVCTEGPVFNINELTW